MGQTANIPHPAAGMSSGLDMILLSNGHYIPEELGSYPGLKEFLQVSSF